MLKLETQGYVSTPDEDWVESCWYKDHCQKKFCGPGHEKDFCKRNYVMNQLADFALLQGKQRYPAKLQVPRDDAEAYRRLVNIQSNIGEFVQTSQNLLIYSKNTGNGKTEWAKKLLLSYLDSIWPVTAIECRALFVSMPSFLPSAKDSVNGRKEVFSLYDYVKSVCDTADLIVWDEISYKQWTDFEIAEMQRIIDRRIQLGLSNIYTSNYTAEELSGLLDTRLASRIVGASNKVEFVSGDKRGKSLANTPENGGRKW